MALSLLKRNSKCFSFTVFFIFLFTVCCGALSAGTPVSGRFTSSSGTNIVLNLTVQSPAPSALIVEEYFPPGNQVVSTSPKAKKINRNQGSIKWLFKNIKNGSYTLSTKFNGPLKGQVRAIVRYRGAKGGEMVEFHIQP